MRDHRSGRRAQEYVDDRREDIRATEAVLAATWRPRAVGAGLTDAEGRALAVSVDGRGPSVRWTPP